MLLVNGSRLLFSGGDAIQGWKKPVEVKKKLNLNLAFTYQK